MKIMKKIKQLLVAFLLLFVIISCENEPYDGNKKLDVITKDSKLFKLLSRVSNETSDPLKDIVCIDFIYPFTTILYNSNFENIGTIVITGDIQFSKFLAKLPNGHSIGISYPITTTLADGTVFTVNNNEELKIAIDSCSKEDIIVYSSNLFADNNGKKCIWKIPYTSDGQNKYYGGVFDVNIDNTITFRFQDKNYKGVWNFLFINDELCININLEGNSEVARDWNFNKKVIVTYEKIIIDDKPKKIILNKSCESNIVYRIGEEGPAGGTVFFDKGAYNNGWRYIEAAPTDLGLFEWGCLGSDIQNVSKQEIGNGLNNTASIVNFHDNLQNFYSNPSICNSLNNGSVAAKETLKLSINGYKDWFLPSIGELRVAYENLHLKKLGNFITSVYWSSTGVDKDNAKSIDFTTGNENIVSKIPNPNYVKTRAVRYF
jgi:hypothetical protein